MGKNHCNQTAKREVEIQKGGTEIRCIYSKNAFNDVDKADLFLSEIQLSKSSYEDVLDLQF